MNNNKEERKLAVCLPVYFIFNDCIEFIHAPFRVNIAAKKPLLSQVWLISLKISVSTYRL